MTSPPRATVRLAATSPGAVHVAHSPPGVFIQPSKETDMLLEYEDTIFQAHCAIDTIANNFDDGGTLQACADDVVTMYLSDGSETSINLDPIQRFLDAMRGLPKSPDS